MKKFTFAVIISLLLVLAIWGTGLAALPGSDWWSALQIQNISETPGSVSMEAYDMGTTAPIASDLFNFDPAKALVYDPGKSPNYPGGNVIGFQSSLPSGFEGSVVISASVPSASVSQLANYSNGSVGGAGKASAMYPGVSSEMLAQELLAPTIKHNYSGATTSMYIQAAGAEADVTVVYTMADGGVYVVNQTIAANRSFMFDPAGAGIPSTGCGFDTMTSPCYGSAIITADAPIAGVLVEHAHSGTPATFVQAIRLSTSQDMSEVIYVPSVKNKFCGSSGCGVAGAAVMNVGSSPADVTITLTVTKLGNNAPSGVSKGDVYIDNATIPAGENYNFSKWNNNLGGLPEGTMAAAVIECTNGQPLVGSSNDAKTQGSFPGQAKVKYSAFPDALATPLAYAPMVKEMYGIFTGGATVQNVGENPDYIIIEYHEYGTGEVCAMVTKDPVPVGGAAETNWVSVNGSTQFDITYGDCGSFGWLSGKQFSIRAYTDGGEDIVLMVTENTPGSTHDISRYEGVNVDPIP